VTLEIDRAIVLNYKILEIYEIWHWENESTYDPITKTGGFFFLTIFFLLKTFQLLWFQGLFTSYLNSALKRKTEASGYPLGCETEEEKDAFIKDYYENEGILLDKEKIVKNSAQRLINKLWANCLWGYLALNTNRTQFRIINSPAEWQLLLQNDRYEITNVFFAETNQIQVSFKEQDEYHVGNNKTNVVLASFVTAQARIHLFNEIEKIGRNVLYMDT
jgi:hypothetical protein